MIETEGIDERVVADLWERQAFRPDALQKLGLRVVFRGVPSDAGGPDYQEALLSRYDRELIRGDVEFHVRSSDWYRHGHHEDRRYNGVMLHVVWLRDSTKTEREDGVSVPVLELQACHTSPVMAEVDGNESRLLTHPCVPAYARLSPDELRRRLAEAGRALLRERASRFEADLGLVGPHQLAYAALLEGLGYASNRDAFRKLADALPFAWLQSIPSELWATALLEGSGLAPPTLPSIPARLDGRMWRLTRLRPANHPALRLKGFALLLRELGSRPADRLRAAVLEAERPSQLRALLTVRTDGQALIGAGRADELIVSVVLPLVAALEPQSARPGELLERYPSPPSNRWTRVMQGLLAEAGHELVPRNAAEHQGLHYLYHRHCRAERRGECPVCGAGQESGLVEVEG